MTKIKVLFVSTNVSYGGGETLLLRTLDSIDKSEMTPIVAISRRNERLGAEITRRGIVWVTLPDINLLWKNKFAKALAQFPNFLLLNFFVAWLIIAKRPRVVHAGMFYSALFSVIPSKLLGKRFVWVGQTLSDFVRYPMLSRWLIRFADKTVLTCADFIRVLEENKMPIKDKAEVIYTGLMEEDFNELSARDIFQFGTKSIRRPIVALIARYDEAQKGHKYFWEMAHIIHRKMPEVNFVVAGKVISSVEQEFKDRLDQLTISLGLAECLFCIGFVSLRELLPSVNVVVVSSVYEAPSAVAYETAALKKPVVAFRVGGIPEVIQDGKGGFLVPFGDVSGLAEKTMIILSNPRMAEEMGEKGRSFVRDRFSQKIFSETYNRIYKSLAEK